MEDNFEDFRERLKQALVTNYSNSDQREREVSGFRGIGWQR